MVKTAEDLETQLLRLDRKFERLDDGTVLVRVAANQPPAALRLSEPVLVAQVEIGPLPSGPEAGQLYRRLLELNASSLVHAAYAIAEDTIVLVASLELISLDVNELEAVLNDFDLALAEHVSELRALSGDTLAQN